MTLHKHDQLIYIELYGPLWKSEFWWRSHLRHVCRVFGHKWGPGLGGRTCRRCGGIVGHTARVMYFDNFGISIADVRRAVEEAVENDSQHGGADE